MQSPPHKQHTHVSGNEKMPKIAVIANSFFAFSLALRLPQQVHRAQVEWFVKSIQVCNFSGAPTLCGTTF
jgi:hypothetical protein